MSGNRFGEHVPQWQPPVLPQGEPLEGRHVRLERLLAEEHAAELYQAFSADDSIWDYMPHGPFHSAAAFHRWVKDATARTDMVYYALRDLTTGQAAGVAAFMRMDPANGVIEIGSLTFAPAMQRTPASTEAIFLMMRWIFEHGYRRCEWKCNAFNLPSRRAAQRLGFSYEGLFRQHMIVKGRNRDTAWFACIDSEWPALNPAFEKWLSPANFTSDGQQVERLSDLTRGIRTASDPAL